MNENGRETGNTSRLLRRINAINCLKILNEKGAMTRADLARALGTTRTTVGYAVQELMDAGIVRATGGSVESPSRGRPGTAVGLAPEGAYFVGVEISVERVVVLVANFVLDTLSLVEAPIDVQANGPDAVLALVNRHAFDLIRTLGLTPGDVYGMGISISGVVTPTGRAFLPAFDLWHDVPLAERVKRDVPESWVVRCCNDASAVALRLVELLEEADKQDLLVVLLETGGIGSAYIRNGAVDKGAHGMAGEIGHFCFSERISDETSLFQTIAACYLAEAGASASDAALHRWGDLMAVGLLNAIYALDPANIVVTGPLVPQFLQIESRVERALDQRARLGFETPRISVMPSDRSMAAMGAAALVRQNFFQMPTFVEEAIGR